MFSDSTAAALSRTSFCVFRRPPISESTRSALAFSCLLRSDSRAGLLHELHVLGGDVLHRRCGEGVEEGLELVHGRTEPDQALDVHDFEGLAASLDQVTGATTRATRAAIYNDLERTGALKTLNQYGVSSRTAVDAVLGHGAALHQVQAIQASATAEMRKNEAAIAANNAEIERLTSNTADMTVEDYDTVDALHKQNGASPPASRPSRDL